MLGTFLLSCPKAFLLSPSFQCTTRPILPLETLTEEELLEVACSPTIDSLGKWQGRRLLFPTPTPNIHFSGFSF